MNKTLVILTILFGGLSVARAQAPKNWIRTAKKKVVTRGDFTINHYGQWTSPDGTKAAIATGAPLIADLQEVRNHLAGIKSGVLRSGTYPLKYEVLQEPHPGMVLRGQVERDDGELFENTYVLITKKEVIMLKVNSAVADSKLDLSEWKFGDLLDQGRAEHLELMTDMVKRSNSSIEKFQKLVEELRQAQKSRKNPKQDKR